MHKTLSLALLMLLPVHGFAEIRFAGVFNNNCVLQRDMPLPIWGWGEPGEKVLVELAGARKEAVADPSGKWVATFDPMPAGGPFTLTASGSTTVEFKNVLIGEVWIGVGQSNMMMGVGSSEGGKEAIEALAAYPNLRMAHEPGKIANEPEPDVKRANWNTPNSSSSATSFYFARSLYDHFKGEVPVGILNFTEIRPVEAWTDGKLLEADPVGKSAMPPKSGWDSGRLFNGIVVPVSPMAIRGVLYYQGEMNGGAGMRFHTLMSLLIQSWRQAWGRPDLPFLFVQLPGYQDHRVGTDKKMDMDAASLQRLNEGSQHGFVALRQAQMETFRKVPHTGMAVTIDVGMPWDIHPICKRQVGERLSLQARHVAYGDQSVVHTGPIMKNVTIRGREAVVTFELGGSTLKFKDGQAESGGFMMAGMDGFFHPAEGRIEGDTVVVQCPLVDIPAMIRYAWAGYPETPLFNASDLPAAPFQWINYGTAAAASKATFSFANPDFQNKAEGWTLANGAELVNLPDGTAAVKLPVKGELKYPSTQVAGLSANAFPLDNPHFARPGSLIGYEIEVASGGGSKAMGYFRLAGTKVGNYFDERKVEADTDSFSLRKIVLGVPPTAKPGSMEFFSIGNVARENTPDQEVLLVRKLSSFTILRPELKWEGPKQIDLGHVKPGATAESPSLAVTNGQMESLTAQITDDASLAESRSTVLYGLADVPIEPAESLRPLQTVVLDANVGVTLVGGQIGSFKLSGLNVTDDGMGLRIKGLDGKDGLAGGSDAEKEAFTVIFKGADKPGIYATTLRIVTQAANLGRMSQGAEGEPPVNLFYLDIPVTVQIP